MHSSSTFNLPAVAAAIALAAGAGAAQAQFVTNGDFESPAVSANTNYAGLGSSTPFITGWYANTGTTVTLIDTIGNQYLQLDRNESVAAALAPNSFTGISPGYTYDLTFSYFGSNSGTGNGAPNTQVGSWSIVTGSNPFSGATLIASSTLTEKPDYPSAPDPVTVQFTLPGSTNYPANSVWAVFTASAPSNNNNVVTLNIDNVQVVPEPETYAMLLAGLGAIGFMARRRSHRG